MVCQEGVHFTCNNTLCIDLQLLCDGGNDCGDNSDEGSICDTCPSTFFKCPKGKLCIQTEHVCDGHPDCSDGADELNCSSCK